MQQLAGVIRNLARRIGVLPSQNDIPRQVLRQRWSALYVPWMWAAAEGNEQAPIASWIASTANAVTDVPVAGTPTGGHQAARAAWEGLCHAYRAWGIHTRADLADWIQAQGFPRPRCGAHFSGRAQERILQEAGQLDVRAAAIEDVIVRIALEAVRRRADSHQQPSQPMSRAQRRRQRATAHRPRPVPESPPDDSWPQLDAIDLRAVFQQRFGVLQSCPAFLKGRFRQAIRHALEARHAATQASEEAMIRMSRKLFC